MVRVSSSETPGVREVDTRKIRSAEAATYSSRIRLVRRGKTADTWNPGSAICRKLLMDSLGIAAEGAGQFASGFRVLPNGNRLRRALGRGLHAQMRRQRSVRSND